MHSHQEPCTVWVGEFFEMSTQEPELAAGADKVPSVPSEVQKRSETAVSATSR